MPCAAPTHEEVPTMRSNSRWELLRVNAYWPGLSFMWNTLHTILLPAVLLTFVDDARNNTAHGPAQGLMHDRVAPERVGLASGVKNFLDMAGLVVSSLVAGRLLSPENPEPMGLIALVAGLMILGAAATAAGGRGGPGPALPPPANPPQLPGDLLATIVLSLIAFSILTGYLCDRIGRKPLHVAAAILVAIGSMLMLLASSAGQVLVFGSIIGAGIGVFVTANWALANDLAPAGEAGGVAGGAPPCPPRGGGGRRAPRA